jgi:heme O synthase-like polyprenyltransferase
MFKNEENRMWVYLAVPTFIIGTLIIYYGEQKYQYIALLGFWAIFYLWRFFYRRKQKKERKKKIS